MPKATEIKKPVLGQILKDVRAAKDALRDRLLRSIVAGGPQALAMRRKKSFAAAPPVNIVGFGIGEKITGKALTGEMCVKIFVARKFAKSRMGKADALPASVDGIPTDIEEVGYPRPFPIANRTRHRPVRGGISVGLGTDVVDFKFAGTLGTVVRDKANPKKLFALSNNHVLADENRVEMGARVVQPGTLDGGGNSDRIGDLDRFVPLKFTNQRNYMDAALARLETNSIDLAILGIGNPSGSGRPMLGMLVRKSGRTTGLTEGVVRAVNFDVLNIQYDSGMVRVDDCIVIRTVGGTGSFSQPGDSGSAIVDSQGRVVGLLFAGSDVVTFATPIARVLRRLKVKIAT